MAVEWLVLVSADVHPRQTSGCSQPEAVFRAIALTGCSWPNAAGHHTALDWLQPAYAWLMRYQKPCPRRVLVALLESISNSHPRVWDAFLETASLKAQV